MPALVATLEGLPPGDLCTHGRPAEFCTLCRRGSGSKCDRGEPHLWDPRSGRCTWCGVKGRSSPVDLGALTLSEAGGCGCQGGCRLCRHGLSDAQVGTWNALPARARSMANLMMVTARRAPPAARSPFVGLGADVAQRPLTTHEKWSIAIGLAGLALSIATTLALLHRTRR